MTPPATVTEAQPTVEIPAETEGAPIDGVLADVLIEEISIDGMCGVY